MRTLSNLLNRSQYGMVLDWNFHKAKQWVSVFPPYLVEDFIKEFNPLIITSQREYQFHKRQLKFILAMEPGWAAPKIAFDRKCDHMLAVMASDPHNKTGWFAEYVEKNGVAFVLSQYCRPFFYHFPHFPEDRFIHFPWAVPDCYLSTKELTAESDRVVIFGAQSGEAYDVRNWCREQSVVENHYNSGVEGKIWSDQQYFSWLASCDALVAAGSSDPAFDLVTPKYFEIAAAGSLLIGQNCTDLAALGFNDENMVIFQRDDFLNKVRAFKNHPETYLPIRERGRDLIAERHLVSHRIKLLKQLFT